MLQRQRDRYQQWSTKPHWKDLILRDGKKEFYLLKYTTNYRWANASSAMGLLVIVSNGLARAIKTRKSTAGRLGVLYSPEVDTSNYILINRAPTFSGRLWLTLATTSSIHSIFECPCTG